MIYLELFWSFFKIGLFTFGGGYAMIPLIQQQVMDHGWMSMAQLIDFIAVSESTPGPIALNMATFVGTESAGISGALCATFGVVLPSFIIILIVAKFYVSFKNSKPIKGIMTGLRPAAIGLIGSAAISVSLTVFFPTGFSFETVMSYPFLYSLVIFAAMLILIFKKVHPIIIVAISAALGIAAGYIGQLL